MAQPAAKASSISESKKPASDAVVRSQSILIETRKQDEAKLFEVSSEKLDLGRSDTFRYGVLTRVLGENYEGALAEVKSFLAREHEFPNFKEKVSRLTSHCVDLIYAIKAKRRFPGLSSLTRPKQQELREKYLQHFRELQGTLRRIEKVERDLEIADARSTIYVVKAIWVTLFAIIILAFSLEIIRGLAVTSFVVADEAYTKVIEFTFDLLGL
jgi:uncharacterized protein YnzC (UPF0291/DUF896 family)